MTVQDVNVINPIEIKNAVVSHVLTAWGQVDIIQSATFGEILVSFLLVVLIVVMIFSIIQKAVS